MKHSSSRFPRRSARITGDTLMLLGQPGLFPTQEEPGPDQHVMRVDIGPPTKDIAAEIMRELREPAASDPAERHTDLKQTRAGTSPELVTSQ